MKLVLLRDCINKKTYDMYQDIPKEEIGSSNIMFNKTYEEFLNKCDEYMQEETIINPQLNTTTIRYILYDNNVAIGEVGIRTTKNEFWINKGSQIFYKIRQSKRGLGYGNKILELALKKAKKMQFDKVRINCDNNNFLSKKVILKNGGIVDIKDYKTKDGYSSSYIIYINE